MKFREHRGSLAESMDTVVELEGRNALLRHCQELLAPYQFNFEPEALKVEPYSREPDTRIDWDQTYVVKIDDYGVMGFTNSAC